MSQTKRDRKREMPAHFTDELTSQQARDGRLDSVVSC